MSAMLAAFVPTTVAQTFSPSMLEDIFARFQNSNARAQDQLRSDISAFWDWIIKQDVDEIRNFVPTIMKTLDEGEPSMRISASGFLSSLAYFRRDDILRVIDGYEEKIIAGFEDHNPRVRANLVGVIAGAEPAPPLDAIEPLRKIVEGSPSRLQEGALMGLARAAPDQLDIAEAIVAAVDRAEDPERRRGLVRALGFARARHPLVIAKIVEQLDDNHRLLREDAIGALTRIGPPAESAVPKLRAIASDPNAESSLRVGAEAALKSIGKAETSP